jgi:hypothetical protein
MAATPLVVSPLSTIRALAIFHSILLNLEDSLEFFGTLLGEPLNLWTMIPCVSSFTAITAPWASTVVSHLFLRVKG